MNKFNTKLGLAIIVMAMLAGMFAEKAGACSRIVYHGLDSLYVIGRSLDWKTPIPTNIYVYPAGIHKYGAPDGGVEWTSKYGAVYAVGYDGGVTEGMNEKGLVINGLFCKGTVYNNTQTESRPPISLAMFVAWLLDMNETTDEVVAVLQKHDFSIFGATFDGGTVSALHWGITDASGKTAMLEFDNGDIKIYYPDNYWAMTNDPQWPSMTAILAYWDRVGGQNMLPGTVASADRCVRANYFVHHVKSVADPDLATSICRSVMMNVSVPYTYMIEGSPELSSTQWRSYSDTKERRYWFDVVTNPGCFYVDLKKCDLRKGAHVMKIDTSKSSEYVGDATKYLKKVAPFTPMY